MKDMNHQETKEEIIRRWKQILTDYFALKDEVIKRVCSLDFNSIINNLKVIEKNICFTQRGSDNYLISNNYLELEYSYEDVYLDEIFPHYREQLSHYNEKHEETYYYDLYTSNPDLNLLKQKIEFEYKDKAWEAYRYRYNRQHHIDSLFNAWRGRACYGKCDFYYVIRYKHGLNILINYLSSTFRDKDIDELLKTVMSNPEQFSECTLNPETTYWIF